MSERVQFISMKAKNYMSFASIEHEFKTGLYIVLGQNHDSDKAQSNGSGKSSLVELPGFLIYGEFEREDPSTDGKGDFEGEIVWMKGSVTYRIHRFFHHKKNANKAFIYRDGENITPVRIAEVKDLILESIGMSYELFVHTVAILQNLMPSFTALTPTIRKGVIEDMIGSTFYAEYKQRFNAKLKEISRDKQKVDGEFGVVQGSLISKNSELETSKQLMGSVITEIEAEIAQFTLQLGVAQAEYAAFPKYDIANLQKMGTRLQAARNEVSSLASEAAQYRSSLARKSCQVCGSVMAADKVMELEKKAEMADVLKGMAEVKVAEAEPVYVKLNGEYQASILEQNTIGNRVTNFTASLQGAQARLAKNKVKVDIAAIEAVIGELKVSLAYCIQQQGDLGQKQEIAGYLEKLMLPSSPFRSFIIKKYLGYINVALAEISPAILDGVVIYLEMGSTEGVEIKMEKSEGKWISYKNLSGGEKRRVDAVFTLTFQRFITEVTGAGSNVLFLDEITEGVDAVGVENVVQAVSELFSGSCVYMISHSDNIKTMFDKCITAHKHGGISTLVESN